MPEKTPRIAVPPSDVDQIIRKLPAFEGFPYLVTQIVGAFYHITVLPIEFSAEALREVAAHQVSANQLPTCLVTGPRTCTYFDVGGGQTPATEIPRGGHVISDVLRLWVDFVESAELLRRKRLLSNFVEERNRGGGYLLGDLTKGGRPASTDELRRLSGWQASCVPRGLEECLQCGDWRGECLDPNPEFAGMLMRVCCRCENDNRCARCGGLLYARKLNANYFEPADGMIWHVPGFSGLSHRCTEMIQWSRA